MVGFSDFFSIYKLYHKFGLILGIVVWYADALWERNETKKEVSGSTSSVEPGHHHTTQPKIYSRRGTDPGMTTDAKYPAIPIIASRAFLSSFMAMSSFCASDILAHRPVQSMQASLSISPVKDFPSISPRYLIPSMTAQKTMN